MGAVSAGLPPLSVPKFDAGLCAQLLPAAALISLVGFVESIPVSQMLAAKRRERIDATRSWWGSAVLSVRVDESLYFADARHRVDRLYDEIARRPDIRHVVLMCPAVNYIDASALDSLESINERLGHGVARSHGYDAH